ncbi:MAG: membrane-bound lytic murein transglycosylase MltF [Gammaproteobacteria bacterium]|nr:MAG: membrane-bound lytic murein transglycosylase MltF [Gammaproteobacteria bacterium]
MAGLAIASFTLLVISGLALAGCSKPPTLLEQVRQQNELVVLTRNSPTTYYEGPEGPAGLEYDLVKRFSESLGVELRIVVPENFNDILPLVVRGDAHLAAAGLTVTDRRREQVRFGPVYQEVTQELVYRYGSGQPDSPDDLKGILEIVAGSSHAERLHELQGEYPDLTWQEVENAESEELLINVWQQLIDYTVVDSNELTINRRYYPELRPAFTLSPPEQLAWAFARSDDDSLYNAAVAFFEKIKSDGTLEQLIERYYGHITEFDYVGTRKYQAHIEQRLPAYRELFREAAAEHGLDWRLLAAVGYQESHWNPEAVSPTGVRGIMMLTHAAAKDLGITDRMDPAQSIHGGARYLTNMINNIPERIPEPDRTWLALASYNVGFGHLEDARVLTQKNKGDYDKWIDVKQNLPLLSQKKWFQQTRYGYARGREPVRYVENIRSYYDILVWYTERELAEAEKARPVQFDSPAL